MAQNYRTRLLAATGGVHASPKNFAQGFRGWISRMDFAALISRRPAAMLAEAAEGVAFGRNR
jgi:hypothetical protein